MATTADEKLTARITTRVPESVHSLLSEAATLVGATINQFVVQSALDRANSVIEHERLITLNAEASQRFVDALENPPAPNEKLKAAFRAHREKL
jgi:uncharacterized protein (DUF1778 family)